MKKSKSIDIKSLQLGNVDSWADFAWHYSPERFSRAFAKYGILVEDENDITQLINMHQRKGDINGDFKDKNGNSVVFNFMDVITKEIDVDKSELKKKFLATNDFSLVKRMNSFVVKPLRPNAENNPDYKTVIGGTASKVGDGTFRCAHAGGQNSFFHVPGDGTLNDAYYWIKDCRNGELGSMGPGVITFTPKNNYTTRT